MQLLQPAHLLRRNIHQPRRHRRLDHQPGLMHLTRPRPPHLQQQRHITNHRPRIRPLHHRPPRPPPPNLNQRLRLQNPQRLPQRVPRHLKRLQQITLRRQHLIRSQLPPNNQPPQLPRNQMRHLPHPRPTRRPTPHQRTQLHQWSHLRSPEGCCRARGGSVVICT